MMMVRDQRIFVSDRTSDKQGRLLLHMMIINKIKIIHAALRYLGLFPSRPN
jgi:hypothetical protein